MRAISFAANVEQIKNRSKTVTRRTGWRWLKPGDELRAISKCNFTRQDSERAEPGERIETLGTIRVVSTRIEPLKAIDKADVIREGFPKMTPEEFVTMFCGLCNCNPDTMVNRIEFEYVLDLDEIKRRCAAVAPGPWWWEYNYQHSSPFYDDNRVSTHWNLVNPASAAEGRTIEWSLVSWTDTYANNDQVPWSETPNYQFIAHARHDIEQLLAEVVRLRHMLGMNDDGELEYVDIEAEA